MIIWGTKIVRKRLGYVADFCPIDREPTAFRLTRVGEASHLYYLSIGSGKLIGHEICCEVCGVTIEAELDRYASISKRPTELLELLGQTFPNLTEVYRERLELEQRMGSGELTSIERRDLIREPFMLLNSLLEARGSETSFDWQSGMGCLALFVVPALLYGLLSTVAPTLQATGMIVLVVAGLMLVWSLYLVFTEVGRYMRREIYPRLASALVPLDPDLGELKETLGYLRDVGLVIAKSKAQPILELIGEGRAGSGK